MNKHLIACAMALLLSPSLFSQNVSWYHPTGGSVEMGIAADSFNHLRILTSLNGTYDFDPGPADATIATGGSRRFVLQSYRADGTFRWARMHGGANIDTTSCRLTLDPRGNAYVFGLFSETADFDPGPGEYLITAASSNKETYLAKYDTLGNLVWAKSFGAVNFYSGEIGGPHIDIDGNIYLAPTIFTTMDVDPGPGQFIITPNDWDPSVLKFDANGNFVWAINVGSDQKERGVTVCTDAQKNVYLLGDMTDDADMDPGPGTFTLTAGPGTHDAFVLKVDSNGVFVWARQFQCLQQYGKVYPIGLDVDNVGNAYVTGYFLTKMDLDPGPAVQSVTAKGLNDIFVAKFDPDGNKVYSYHLGTGDLDTGTGIVADGLGNAYLTGYITEDIDVDPGPDTLLTGTEFGSYDGFVLSYDAQGNVRWVRRFGGPENDTGYFLTVDNLNRVFFANRMDQVYNLGFAPGEEFVVPTTVERVMVIRIDQENNYHGTVFRDFNGNQMRDAGEPGLQGVLIEAPEENLYVTSQLGGGYAFYHDFDADTLKPKAPQPYWTITPPFALTDSLNPVADFAVTFPSDYRDVDVKAFPNGSVRPGFYTEVEIHLTNLSSEAVDSVWVTLGDLQQPPAFTLVQSNPAPAAFDGHQVLWYSDTLAPGAKTIFWVQLETSDTALLNTPVGLTVIAGLPNDANPVNDTSRIVSAVTGSFDPNDKLVFPSEIQAPELDSTVLYYTIRFQNTGNAAAEFVILRDTLLPDLDPASLQVLGASHPYSWRLHGENIFEVRFDGINLPDSTTDLEGSQGFVAFTLKPRTGLGVGDTVYNRAGIYFDYNAVVLTQWAKAAIVMQSVAAQEPFGNTGVLKIYPNPAHGQCTVSSQGKLSGPGEMVLFDAGGKVCLRRQVAETGQPFELAGLPGVGLFFVKLKTGKGEMNGVLISNQ